MSNYEMSYPSNWKKHLADYGLEFSNTLSTEHQKAGELAQAKYEGEIVGWRETDAIGIVEVTNYLTGEIFTLLGDIQTAESLALSLAILYAK